jgi:hypothetical protein
MKAKSLISAIGPGTAVAVVVGLVAAFSVEASNAEIKVSRYAAPCPCAARPASPIVANVKQTEVQVAVMAKSPAQVMAKRAVFIRR